MELSPRSEFISESSSSIIGAVVLGVTLLVVAAAKESSVSESSPRSIIVVLALFFGGARAAIRVMQGKPAATEPEFLRIDLSGRPTRIQPDGPGANPQG